MPLGFRTFVPSFGGERTVNIRPAQNAAPSSSAPAATQRKTLGGKGIIGGGKEKSGQAGVGLGKGGLKRHRYVMFRFSKHCGIIHEAVAIRDDHFTSMLRFG